MTAHQYLVDLLKELAVDVNSQDIPESVKKDFQEIEQHLEDGVTAKAYCVSPAAVINKFASYKFVPLELLSLLQTFAINQFELRSERLEEAESKINKIPVNFIVTHVEKYVMSKEFVSLTGAPDTDAEFASMVIDSAFIFLESILKELHDNRLSAQLARGLHKLGGSSGKESDKIHLIKMLQKHNEQLLSYDSETDNDTIHKRADELKAELEELSKTKALCYMMHQIRDSSDMVDYIVALRGVAAIIMADRGYTVSSFKAQFSIRSVIEASDSMQAAKSLPDKD